MESNTTKDLEVTNNNTRGEKNFDVFTHSDCSCLATFKKHKKVLNN